MTHYSFIVNIVKTCRFEAKALYCSPMRFCSSCGQPVALHQIANDARPRFVCSSCGSVHYSNPRILVACLAYHGERILMCRRAHEPRRGLWALPAGFMEENESLEQAAARETLEETGVEVSPAALVLYSILSLPHMNQVYVTFRTELPTVPQMQPGPESLDVALIGEHDIRRDEWAFGSLLSESRPAEMFREIRTRTFSIHQMRHGDLFEMRDESRVHALKDST
jgi:ADP-ribose pyrophosphatase YjhB (NUDIX family)